MQYSVISQGLTKRYKQQTAVNQLDLAIPEGSVYGFLGPNGAGKTTTLKMLLGLVRPTSGDVTLLGHSLTAKNRLKILQEVGSLIEQPSYYGHLSARENLEIIRQLRNLPVTAIDEALETVRLDPRSKKLTKHFSLGMKQRLGIAAALMGRPRLLLLDEPTNGLDPAGIQEMRALIKSLPAEQGISVVVSSHLLAEVDQMADYVGIIERGHLVFQDSLTTLRLRAKLYLAIRTTDNSRAAAMFPTAQLVDGWMMVGMLDDAQVAKACIQLAEQGIGILRIEERRDSLEEVFLQMTQGEASL